MTAWRKSPDCNPMRPAAFTREASAAYCQVRAKTRTCCSVKYAGLEYTPAGRVDDSRMSSSMSIRGIEGFISMEITLSARNFRAGAAY